MAKIREALAKVAEALGLNERLLARAVRRYKANRKRAYTAHNKQEQAHAKADRLRVEGHLLAAAGEDKRASRCSQRAFKNHNRAQHYLGAIKRYQQRINGLEADHAALVEKLKKANKVTVKGNKVSGGTARGRLRVAIHTAAANCSSGLQRNYYSMSGATPDHSHTLQGMPYGHRFDCSSFADGIYECCYLPNPSRTSDGSGYTGTEGEHGTQVSKSEARTGDLVLYGPFPHHHVEVVDDPDHETTIGHGSAPIDAGIFDLFGDRDFIIRSYV